jgi:PUA domain protein
MSESIRNRHKLKSKEIRRIIQKLDKDYSQLFFNDKSIVESGDFKNFKLLLIDGHPCFILSEGKLFFTIFGVNRFKPKERFVTVDIGAIRFVTNGADVMAPGIVDADNSINTGNSVWIRDEKHHKVLAVGIALMNGSQMILGSKGKSVSIIHYVSDELWTFIKRTT